MLVDEALETASNVVQLFMFSAFLFLARRLLLKQRKSLDIHMKATLVFIGLSLVVIQMDTLYFFIFGNSIPPLFDVLLTGYPNQFLEKTGIFIDIARLSIVIGCLNGANGELVKKLKARANTGLWVAIIVLILLTAGIYYCFLEIEEVDIFSEADRDEHMSQTLIILECAYSLYSNGGIILAYLVIYLILRSHSRRLTLLDPRQKQIRDSLRSLLLLFLSICQIYLFRICRDFFIVTENFAALETVRPIFYLCKTVMVLGICVSIY